MPRRLPLLLVALALVGSAPTEADANRGRAATRADRSSEARAKRTAPVARARPATRRPAERRARESRAPRFARRAQRRAPGVDPHVHGSAVVRGANLIHLARRHGRLRAGLAALGLDHLPEPAAVRAALRRMDLSQPAHGDAYGAIRAFRTAAFSGPSYVHWVRATAQTAKARARMTYMQMRLDEADAFVDTARAHGIDLSGIGILASIGRGDVGSPRRLAEAIRRNPRLVGLDVVGAETRAQSPRALHAAIDALRASGRSGLVLRIHAGEGYLGEGGHDNVNIVLGELERRSRTQDLSGIKILLAHAARIRDVGAASRDLRALIRRGVTVEVNVNPLSNLVYGAVADLGDIDAFKLEGAKFVAGTDNVGSLRTNREILRLLEKGDVAGARDRARHFIRLRDRWAAELGRAGTADGRGARGHVHAHDHDHAGH